VALKRRARAGGRWRLGAATAFCLAISGTAAAAQPGPIGAEPLQQFGAQLQIEPKRIVLTPDRPEGRITLGMPWGEADFDVTLVDRIMLPDGRILAVSESAGEAEAPEVINRLRSARSFVAAAPADVALKAGDPAADVRVALTAPPAEPGEYRTHLTITARTPPDEGTATRLAWAHTIPVIVRVGPVDARGAIENARVEMREVANGQGLPVRQRVLVCDLVRTGANSLFGDLTLHGRDGLVVPVASGIGVYAELERRHMAFPLNGAASGIVELRYTDRDARPGEVIATAQVNLSPVVTADVRGGAPAPMHETADD
jgi:hypothetical protein